MKVELNDVVSAVEHAIASLQRDPEQAPADIINSAIGGLEPVAEGAEIREEALSRLRRAAEQTDGLGEHEAAGLLNAVIGTGLAVLAVGTHD